LFDVSRHGHLGESRNLVVIGTHAILGNDMAQEFDTRRADSGFVRGQFQVVKA
jgi:hypothetical protein